MNAKPRYHEPSPLPREVADVMRDLHGRKVSKAMSAKARKGVMPGCAPLGYKNAWVDGERAIIIDPATAPKVRRLFELAGRKRWSLRKLVAEAERMGISSRNGKPFGPSSLKAILENPFYRGKVRWNGETLQGKHEPLVSDALFIGIQKKLFFRSF